MNKQQFFQITWTIFAGATVFAILAGIFSVMTGCGSAETPPEPTGGQAVETSTRANFGAAFTDLDEVFTGYGVDLCPQCSRAKCVHRDE